MKRTLSITVLALAVATTGSAMAAKTKGPSSAARRGLALAEMRCAACHGIKANTSSPNPESPSFEDIANRPGVTRMTMRQFLRDSHNYPAAMQFRIDRWHIADLSDYIITLKKPGYKPAI